MTDRHTASFKRIEELSLAMRSGSIRHTTAAARELGRAAMAAGDEYVRRSDRDLVDGSVYRMTVLEPAEHAMYAGAALRPSAGSYLDVVLDEHVRLAIAGSIAFASGSVSFGAKLVTRAAAIYIHTHATSLGLANVFRLSGGLAERLCATDISSITGRDVAVPFSGLYVSCQDTAVCLEHPQTRELLPLTVFGAALDKLPNGTPSLLLRAFGESRGSGDVASFMCQVDLPPDEAVGASANPQTMGGVPTLHVGGVRYENGDAGACFARLAVGVCLYLSSPNPDVRLASGARGAGAWEEAVTASRTTVRVHQKAGARMLWDVGSRIPRLRAASLDVLVRGHWRRQVHGKGRALRKVIWVEPHVRLPTGAPVAGHDYEVADA